MTDIERILVLEREMDRFRELTAVIKELAAPHGITGGDAMYQVKALVTSLEAEVQRFSMALENP